MDWLQAHLRPIVDSVLYAALGSAILVVAFLAIKRLLPFSLHKEIAEDQNVALGIILGALILGLSLIVSAAIR